MRNLLPTLSRNLLLLVLAGLILVALSSPLQAETKSWVVGTSGWTLSDSWSGGTVPGLSDDAVIANGGSAYLIHQAGPNIHSLTLGGSGGSGDLHWDAPSTSDFITHATSFLGKDGGTGTITLQAGTTWDGSAADLVVGLSGTGVMNINGGTVKNTFAQVGADAGTTGTINVNSGGLWEQTQGLVLGSNGIGNLNVLSGGVAENAEASVGRYAGSRGNVVVSGGASTWSNSSYVQLGDAGAGTLTVSAGGLVRVGWDGNSATGTITLGNSGAGSGILNIGGATTLVADAAAPGTVQAGLIIGGDGSGTKLVNFNHTDSAYVFSSNISGAVDVQQHGSSGSKTILTGDVGVNTVSIDPNTTLQVGNSGTTGNLSAVVTNHGTLAFNRSDSFSSSLTVLGDGSSTLAQNGPGTVTLVNSQAYRGRISVADGGTLAMNDGYTSTGTVVKVGAGTLTLRGASSLSRLAINEGMVVVGNGATAGTLTTLNSPTMATDAVLGFNRSDDVTFTTALLSGGGGIKKFGTNTLTLDSNFIYDGATDIEGGTLVVQRGNTSTNTVGGGALRKTTGDIFTFAPGSSIGHSGGTDIQGGTVEFYSSGDVGGVVNVGLGTSFIFAANGATFDGTFTGAGNVGTQASFSIGLPVASLSGFTGKFQLSSSGGFSFNTETAASLSNAIESNGIFGKGGAGTLTYTGTATNTNGLAITGGRLTLGAGGTTGSYLGTGQVNFYNGTTLEINRSDDLAFAGRFFGGSNNGTFLKSGSNTVTLTSSLDSFSGALTIDGGRLAYNGPATTYLGAINGAGTFVKQGSSTFTLKGPISNTGGTIIEGGTLDLQLDQIRSYAGNISGAGALLLDPNVGNATFTYTGTATHTGGTTINGANLQIGDGGTTGSISGTLTGSNYATLTFDRSDAVTISNAISGFSGLTNSGTGNVTLDGSLAGLNFTNTINVTGAGSLIIGSAFAPNQMIKEGSGRLILAADTTAEVSLRVGTLQIGNGGTSGTLSGNIIATSSPTIRFDRSDDFSYNGSINGGVSLVQAGTNAVTLGGNIEFGSGSSLTISGGKLVIGNGNNWTLAQSISGTGTFEKVGSGFTTLAGASSFTGDTIISDGTLKIGTNSSLNGTATIASDATLSLTNSSTLKIDISGAGDLNNYGIPTINGIVTNTGATTLYGGYALTLGDSRDFTYGSDTSGSGSLTKAGSGTMTVISTLGNTGDSIVSAGTLRIGNADTTGTLANSKTTVNGGATLEIDHSDDITAAGGITNNGTFTKSGTNKVTVMGAFENNDTTNISDGILALSTTSGAASLNGTIQGSGALEKLGSGTIRLNGTAAYTGGTIVSEGTLELNTTSTLAGDISIASSAILGFARGYTFNNTITGAGGIQSFTTSTVNLTGALSYTGLTNISAGPIAFNTSGDVTLSGPISGTNILRKLGASTLTLSGDGSGYTGSAELQGGTLMLASENSIAGEIRLDGGTLSTDAAGRSFSGSRVNVLSNSSIGGDGGDLTLGANTDLQISSLNTTLTKIGTNALVINHAGTFSGQVVINGGTIRLGAGGTLSSGDLTVNTGGTFDVGTSNNVVHDFILDGGNITGTSGTFDIANNGSIDLRSGTVSAILSNTYNHLAFTKSTSGTVTLSGMNTYDGRTEINAGTLAISSAANLGNGASSNTILLGGGTLESTSGTYSLGTNRTITLTAASAIQSDAGTLTVDGRVTNGGKLLTLGGEGNIAISSIISGGGGLAKVGPGTLILSGSNSYSGNTTIQAGTVKATNPFAMGSGAVTVDGGIFLVDTGSAIANEVVLSGGTYQRVVTGSLAHAADATSNLGGQETTAQILAGSSSTATTLVTSFSGSSSASNDGIRISDVYSLAGTGANLFVLQLTFDSIEPGSYVGWLHGGQWINAVEGNIEESNNASASQQGYKGSFFVFQNGDGGSFAGYGTDLANYVGAWGMETSGGTTSAWAVLNHNSDFGAVPEPSTCTLLGLGALAVVFASRKRRKIA